MATLEFRVQNVKCGGCASTIEEALNSINGVENVKVDIAMGMVSVECHDANMETISQKLMEIGFPLTV